MQRKESDKLSHIQEILSNINNGVVAKEAMRQLKQIDNKNLSPEALEQAESCYFKLFEFYKLFYQSDTTLLNRHVSDLWLQMGVYLYSGLDQKNAERGYIKCIEFSEYIPDEQTEDLDKIRSSRAYWNLSYGSSDVNKRIALIKVAVYLLEQVKDLSIENKQELIFSHLVLCRLLEFPAENVGKCLSLLQTNPMVQNLEFQDEVKKFNAGICQKLAQQKVQKSAEEETLQRYHDLHIAALVYKTSGVERLMKNNFHEALSKYNEAIITFEKIPSDALDTGLHKLLSMCHYGKAFAFHKLGQINDASASFEKAEASAKMVKDEKNDEDFLRFLDELNDFKRKLQSAIGNKKKLLSRSSSAYFASQNKKHEESKPDDPSGKKNYHLRQSQSR